MIVLLVRLLHFLIVTSIIIVVLPSCVRKAKSAKETTTAATTPSKTMAPNQAKTPVSKQDEKKAEIATKTPQTSQKNKGEQKQEPCKKGDNETVVNKEASKPDEKNTPITPPAATKPVKKTIKHNVVDKNNEKDIISNPFITEVSDEFPTVEETK